MDSLRMWSTYLFKTHKAASSVYSDHQNFHLVVRGNGRSIYCCLCKLQIISLFIVVEDFITALIGIYGISNNQISWWCFTTPLRRVIVNLRINVESLLCGRLYIYIYIVKKKKKHVVQWMSPITPYWFVTFKSRFDTNSFILNIRFFLWIGEPDPTICGV